MQHLRFAEYFYYRVIQVIEQNDMVDGGRVLEYKQRPETVSDGREEAAILGDSGLSFPFPPPPPPYSTIT